MSRFVVVGLARVRARWFADVSAWANAGRVPIDFVKCVSAAEAVVRLDDVRGASALMVEAGVNGVDRDLIELARERGVITIVVTPDGHGEAWRDLGAIAVLPDVFGHDELVEILTTHAQTIEAPQASVRTLPSDQHAHAPSPLIAVTGVRGTGASTIAIALAQGFATHDPTSSVVLADLVRRGDMALYHDARDVVPGFQEFVEAHRNATPTSEEIASLLFDAQRRGYALLLGLRRLRDWTALRPRAVEASLESLRSMFDLVVVDIDDEVDGEQQTGSADLDERNAPARLSVRDASCVVTTTDPTLRGLHQLLHLQRDLREAGVDRRRLITVINRAPRSPRHRAEITAALSALNAEGGEPGDLAPIFVPERRALELLHATGDPIPGPVIKPVLGAALALLARHDAAVA